MARSFQAFLLASTLFASALTADAQFNVYTTNFGAQNTAASDGFTYTQNELTAGQTVGGGTGQNNWMTNDPDKNPNATTGPYIGGSNYVGPIPGFTGYGAYLGGQRSTTAANDIVPGAATSFLYRNVAVPATTNRLTFDVDFDIASSSTFATKDSFAFVLRNTTGAQLLSINFAISSNVNGSAVAPTNSDFAAGYTIGGTGVGVGVNNNSPSNAGVNFDKLYHLTISVNVTANTFSATLTGANSVAIASNVSLSAAPIPATSVTQIAAAWALSNTATDPNTGAYTSAGGNLLAFDNYAITVPEPSTYAAVALGFATLVWVSRMRRRA